MPWSTTRKPGTAAKYRTREHRERRAQLVRKINAGEYIECVAPLCVMPTRQITETDGRLPHGLNLGHEPDGITYRGPEHRACNVKDGARRGRARQGNATPRRWIL